MPSTLSQGLASLISISAGGINSLLGLFVGTMQKGFQSAIQFHKEGIAFARDMGMSARQAQNYTDTLIRRTEVLANRYGVSAEAIIQVQRGLSEATRRQLLLNDAQAEGFVQIDKLMGAQAKGKFAEEIMNGMGGQIDTVQGAMAKVYATAAKQGLNAKQFSDKVAQNLSMANRLSFRNGVDGITRMAALSEKLGINMQSVESAANQFLELDKAIEGSAHMQMLGGSAAAMFGNPLTASYEANYDPEAFAKRMSDALASYATFDAQKGISNINGMNMDFIRAIGQAMGISPEEAAKMAKKQAEVRFKERQFSPMLGRYGLNEDQRNYLINNGQVRNGELFYTDAKGKEHNVSRGEIDATLLDEIRKFEGMSDKDIMVQQAKTLTSIDEHIEGAATKVAASFAEGIDKYLPNIAKQVQTLGDYLSNYAKQWGADTGKVVGKAMNWISEHGPEIKTVADAILKTFTTLIDIVSKYTVKAILFFFAAKQLLGRFVQGRFGGGYAPVGGGGYGPRGGASPRTSPNMVIPGGPSNGASPSPSNFIRKTIGKDGNTTYWRYGANGNLQRIYNQNEAEALWKQKGILRETKNGKASTFTIGGQQGTIKRTEGQLMRDGARQNAMTGGAQRGAFSRMANSKAIGGLSKAGRFLGKASPWALMGSIGGEILLDELTPDESKNSNWYAGGKAALGALSMASTGAMLGSMAGPIGTAIGGILGGIYGAYSGWKDAKAAANANQPVQHFADGGDVKGRGGIDSAPAMLTPGEIVLSETMQKDLLSILRNPPIQVKPVGEMEYIYVPKGSSTSSIGGNTVTVKDFNVNLNGTIKLDGGNSTTNIDVRSLLNDHQFVNSLKQIIKESINSDMNGGRYMNDVSTLRGHTTSSSILGR